MRTISKYYTRITLSRLSELLDLPTSEAEQVVAKLAVEKMIYAKMDRPAGTITFEAPKTSDGMLNEWASDINKLMVSVHLCFSRMGLKANNFLSTQTLIEKSSHLIARERAVAAAAGGAAQQPIKA